MRRLTLHGVAETHARGARLGALLRVGDFVGLAGSLGAGKTELTRAICEGAGVPMAQVGSPSYAIVATYEGGRVVVHHADLYRVGDLDELYATGYFDLLDRGAAVVEWIDQVPDAAPPDHLSIALEIAGVDSRTLSAQAHGPRSDALLVAWLGG